METFELILLLLACVMVSSIFDQVLPRVSIPLVQIALGMVVGVFFSAGEATVIFSDPELFMLIFIAPLLFDEARHADKQALWENKGAVLSLAIGLVLLTMLVVGFVLHLVVPSIPLAAAFALGAALGPTDAVAVTSLGREVSLSKRQSAHLKGEALINDASGIVSFEFAIAAAVTGTFAVVEALEDFVVDFFGGIILGLVLAAAIMWVLRRVLELGLETSTVYVLLEVCTPFFVYLLAEQVGVSGVLAVVAAGLFMKFFPSSLTVESSRYAIASENVWELVIYIVNGVVFVILGMKLPEIILPTWNEAGGVSADAWLLVLVLLVTVLVVGTRFAWCMGMEVVSARRDPGPKFTRERATSALVTTLSGPKGAVTLSVIMTIPYYAAGGAFPERDLLIFLGSGVVVCTLLLANFVVPVLAPGKDTDESAQARSEAEVEILQNVIERLQEDMTPENRAATISTIAEYRNRIEIAREDDGLEDPIGALRLEVMYDQLEYVRDKMERGEVGRPVGELYAYTLSRRIRSIEREKGRTGSGAHAGQLKTPLSWVVRATTYRLMGRRLDDRDREQMSALVRETEAHAVAYLDDVAAISGAEGKRIAALLRSEHVSEDSVLDTAAAHVGAASFTDTEASSDQQKPSITRAFKTHARVESKSRAVQAKALRLELEQISQMREADRISPADARELRNEVYVLQMGLEAR